MEEGSDRGRKVMWRSSEDDALRAAVEAALASPEVSISSIPWSQIARQIDGRSGKQCRERWTHHLVGNVRKGPWTMEEDRVLFAAMQEHATHWVEIAKQLPGRTGHCVKNHYYATKRRLARAARKRVATAETSASSALMGFYGADGLGEYDHFGVVDGDFGPADFYDDEYREMRSSAVDGSAAGSALAAAGVAWGAHGGQGGGAAGASASASASASAYADADGGDYPVPKSGAKRRR
jgi:hypothetical protein